MLNKTKAERAVKFIQSLKLYDGEWSGKNFILEDWQRDKIIIPLFGNCNKNGLRQYRTVYIEIPRKNGKTVLAAGIALYLLCADNEHGAQIYSAAADRDQASLVFNAAAQMVRQSDVLSKYCKVINSQKRIIYERTQSFYKAISAEAYTKHGINAHGIIFDELHAQPNRELWDVLRTSTGSRRQPLTVAITTAGYDRNSICWEQHDYARKVQRKIVKDKTFLPVIYSAADLDDNFENVDWTDEKVWQQANPALNKFRKIEEMRSACNTAKETPAYENTFKRLYLNIWTRSQSRWIPAAKWNKCKGSTNPIQLNGMLCYGGLDLASTIDIAAFAKVFPPIDEDDTYKILMKFWIPEESMLEKIKRDRVPYDVWSQQGFITATPGNVIDYGYIKKQINEDSEIYDLREIAFDRWGATKLVQDLTDDGHEVIAMGQGFASMSPPTKELMNLILSERIEHFDNPILKWMADNVVVKLDPAGNIKPDKEKSTDKIDGIVALIMGLDRAVRNEGISQKSIYSERGVLVF